MSRRNQTIVLGVLFVVLVYRAYVTFWPSVDAGPVSGTNGKFVPVDVDNPALRMDILQRFLGIEYKGSHRNIFTAILPAPPAPPPKVAPVVIAPPVPAAPPPLAVNAKYFGYVSDSRGSHRRAFFASANNDDVFIAGEGDTILGRFRVLRLTSKTADLEEISSGRRATLMLEEAGPAG